MSESLEDAYHAILIQHVPSQWKVCCHLIATSELLIQIFGKNILKHYFKKKESFQMCFYKFMIIMQVNFEIFEIVKKSTNKLHMDF